MSWIKNLYEFVCKMLFECYLFSLWLIFDIYFFYFGVVLVSCEDIIKLLRWEFWVNLWSSWIFVKKFLYLCSWYI